MNSVIIQDSMTVFPAVLKGFRIDFLPVNVYNLIVYSFML